MTAPRKAENPTCVTDGDRPTVISVHGPHALSGVTTWAARMAAIDGPLRHRMLIVRRASDPAVDSRFPGSLTPGFRTVTIRDDATLAEEVEAISAELESAGPAIALVHDHIPAAIAAVLSGRPDRALASISHADEPRYADLFERIGPLLDVWWGDSDAASRRAMNDSCRATCAGAFPGGAPRADTPAVTPESFDASAPAPLLWLGRVERYQKRVLDAISMMERLTELGTPATLTIAGDGPAISEVRTRLSDSPAASLCRAIGPVPPSSIPDLLASHHALVMTSLFEGTPVAAAEAAHSARALFVTDGCGGLLDLADPGQIVVTPTGHPALQAEAIHNTVTSPGLLAEYAERAQDFARSRLDQSKIRVKMDNALCDGYRKRAHAMSRTSSAAALPQRWSQILRVIDMHESATEADVLRLRDCFCANHTGCSPHDLVGKLPRLPRLNERLLTEAIEELHSRGMNSLALYGAGHHTRSANRIIVSHPEIVAIIDDNARPGQTIAGVPVVTPADPLTESADAVIISSSEYEDFLAERAEQWAGTRPVRRLYRVGNTLQGVIR